jgi:hypothetical protein
MKEIIIAGCNDISNMFEMLDDISTLIGVYLNIEIVNNNRIKIIYNNSMDKVEKYLLINIDEKITGDIGDYEGYIVITVGFNKKASLTVSSVQNNEDIVFCIQRDIEMANNTIEPQEFKVEGNYFVRENMLNNMFAFSAMLLILENSIDKIKKYF